MMMSIERFFAAFYPFQYKERIKVSTMVKIGIFCVFSAFLASFLVVATLGNEEGTCYSQRKSARDFVVVLMLLETTVVSLILPSIITLVLNTMVAIKITRQTSSR